MGKLIHQRNRCKKKTIQFVYFFFLKFFLKFFLIFSRKKRKCEVIIFLLLLVHKSYRGKKKSSLILTIPNMTKSFQIRIVRVLAVVIAFVTIIMVAINFVYALYSPIQRTAMDANIGFGQISDNTFTSATTTLIFLGSILFALNTGTALTAFISESAVGNVVVIVILALLLIMNLIYLVFSIAWEWIPCNTFIRNDFFNRCNSLFWCCHPDTFTDVDFMCPNWNTTSEIGMACTAGRGEIISSNPAIFDTRDISTMYVVHMITLFVFVVLQIAGLILSAYAIYSSPGELSNFFDMVQNLAGPGGVPGTGAISSNMGSVQVRKKKIRWLDGIKMAFRGPPRRGYNHPDVHNKTHKKKRNIY